MSSVNDVFVYSVTGSDVANFTLRGGIYLVTLVSDSWGTVTLKVLAADDSTYVPFQTWSANAAATLTLVGGSYQFSYASVDTATLAIAQQPPTPTWRLQSLTQPLPINTGSGATNYQTMTGFAAITLETPNASGDTGSLSITTGNSSAGDSGAITLTIGDADGSRGSIVLDAPTFSAPSGFVLDSGTDPITLTVSTETADHGNGSSITVTAGPGGSASGDGGAISLVSGSSPTGVRGNIELDGHLVIIDNLPTSGSGLPSGAVWNSSGTLKVA